MRIGGIASGFDTEQIVSDLMAVERLPIDKIYQQKVKTEWQRDEYRSINTKLASFRDHAFNMTLQSSYMHKKATSSNANVVEITKSNGQVGNYNISVQRLATAAQKTFTYAEGELDLAAKFAEVTSAEDFTGATIKLSSNKIDVPDDYLEIAVNKGDRISDLVSKINGNKELGITAFYDEPTGSLVLGTAATGESAVIKWSIEEDTGLSEIFGSEPESGNIPTGTNAQLTINGLATERESNVFELSGNTFTLKARSDENVSLTVSQDTDAIFNNIKEFIDQYNELIDEINGKLSEPVYRDFSPLTEAQRKDLSEDEVKMWEEKAKSGLLRLDRNLTTLLSDLRRTLGSTVEGLAGNNSLHKIGIKTSIWQERGKLHINETELRDAIEADADQVMSLFTNDPAKTDAGPGIARQIRSVLTTGIDKISNTAGKATSLHDQSTLSERIRGYEDRIAAMEDRLVQVENRYWQQFTAMERVLSEMYSQSDWLMQQFNMM